MQKLLTKTDVITASKENRTRVITVQAYTTLEQSYL